MRNINNALGKNRRILESFIPVGEETFKITKEKLLQKSFQFKYITHSYTNKKGDVYFFCYDYGYLPIGNDWYLLVKRKEEWELKNGRNLALVDNGLLCRETRTYETHTLHSTLLILKNYDVSVLAMAGDFIIVSPYQSQMEKIRLKITIKG